MKKLATLALCTIFLAGCSAQQSATDFANVLGSILNIAKAEEPALPPNDAAVITPWVNVGMTLEGQLQSCIVGAGPSGKKAAFVGCFNTFASGLVNPTELAQLRVVSAGSQSKVQLWATAVIIGVNAALTQFGGSTLPMPVVSGTPASSEQIGRFTEQVSSIDPQTAPFIVVCSSATPCQGIASTR